MYEKVLMFDDRLMFYGEAGEPFSSSITIKYVAKAQ